MYWILVGVALTGLIGYVVVPLALKGEARYTFLAASTAMAPGWSGFVAESQVEKLAALDDELIVAIDVRGRSQLLVIARPTTGRQLEIGDKFLLVSDGWDLSLQALSGESYRVVTH